MPWRRNPAFRSSGYTYRNVTCCTESFIRAAHPIVATFVVRQDSLDYTETLMAAAGEQAEAAKEETMKKYYGNYLLMIEGSLPTKDELIVA